MATKSESISVIPSGYNSTYSSFAGFSNSYPVTNACADTTSTTYAYAQATTTASSTSYVSFKFNTLDIPSSATITSVSCAAKYKVQSTSRITSLSAQLYTNNTSKGTATTTRSTTASVNTIAGGSSWTVSELSNILLRFTMVRGTNTSTSGIYVYGAELTVKYEYEAQTYTVNVTVNGSGTVEPTSAVIFEGGNCTLTLTPESGVDTTITDNGVDVTSQLVERGSEEVDSSVIKAYTTSGSISGTYYQQAVGKGSDATSVTGNNYASSSGSTATISYSFNIGSIPSNASITSVICKVKGHLESTTSSSEVAKCQLYSGSTAKGSVVSFTSTSDTVITVDGGSSWTVSELSSLVLQFTIGYYGGNISGATLEITYEIPGASTRYTYTLTSVSANHNIIVTYGTVTTYTVTTTITNGTLITPASPIEVIEGGSCEFKFVGDDDYEFSSMTINGSSVTPTLIENPGGQGTWSVSTNYSTYQTYNLSNAYDGDTSTFWWSSEAQATGKYVLITFDNPVTLNSFSTYSSSSTDMPKNNNELQVSTDGNSWTTVGTFTNNATTSFSNINKTNIKYARIMAVSDISNWMVINEITIDATLPSDSYYYYKLTPINDDKSVVIIFSQGGPVIYIKRNGSWITASAVYIKQGGAWVSTTTIDTTKKYNHIDV